RSAPAARSARSCRSARGPGRRPRRSPGGLAPPAPPPAPRRARSAAGPRPRPGGRGFPAPLLRGRHRHPLHRRAVSSIPTIPFLTLPIRAGQTYRRGEALNGGTPMRHWLRGMAVGVLLLGGWLVAFTPGHSGQPPAPTRVEDVIYGRKFGTALTLDVFK